MDGAKDRAKQELEQAKDTAQQAAETAKREAASTKDTVAETVKELKAAVDWVAGPPAKDPDEAERQIGELRARLERDVRTLRNRTPQPSQIDPRVKRAAGAVAAVAAAMRLGSAGMRRRGARRDRQREIRDHATWIARELARLDLERVVDEVADEVSEERHGSGPGRLLLMVLGLLAGLAVTWLARQGEASIAPGTD